MIALIDGDILAYQLSAVSTAKEEIFPGVVDEIPWHDSDVYDLVDQTVQSIINETKSDGYEVYLTGPGNFRDSIATVAEYKGHRTRERPYHWSTVRARLAAHWGAKTVCGIEADDIIALEASERKGEVVICSRDKDLRQIEGVHYQWSCGEQQPAVGPWITDSQGYISLSKTSYGSWKLYGCGYTWFYAQLLVGDTADNIKGCPKIGPKKAYELLNGLSTEEELLEVCFYQYALKYPNPMEILMENARLLWLIKDRKDLEVISQDGSSITYAVKRLWGQDDQGTFLQAKADELARNEVRQPSGEADT